MLTHCRELPGRDKVEDVSGGGQNVAALDVLRKSCRFCCWAGPRILFLSLQPSKHPQRQLNVAWILVLRNWKSISTSNSMLWTHQHLMPTPRKHMTTSEPKGWHLHGLPLRRNKNLGTSSWRLYSRRSLAPKSCRNSATSNWRLCFPTARVDGDLQKLSDEELATMAALKHLAEEALLERRRGQKKP